MREIFAEPIDLVINEFTVVFSVREDDSYKATASEYARFMEIAFSVYDGETGEEFSTLANIYSMN